MRTGMRARSFQQLERALDIRFKVCPRFLDGIANTCLRGEVDDMAWFVSGQNVRQQAGCFDLAFDFRVSRIGRQQCRAVAFQLRIVISAETVETNDRPAFLQPAFRRVKADESGRSRDKGRFHSASRAICLRYSP